MKNANNQGNGKINSKERPPSRPFTPYIVFFQLERERILQEYGEGYAAIPPSTKDTNASARPKSYRELILAKDWYIAGSKRNDDGIDKKKRRVHGIMTFVQLTKLISQNWASADKQVKEYCTLMSQENTRRYRIEMDAYIEKYGYESVKRTYKKRKVNVKLNSTAVVSDKSKKSINQVKKLDGTDDAAVQISKLSKSPPVPPDQNSQTRITPIVTASSINLKTDWTSSPEIFSQFLVSINCCNQINPSDYLRRPKVINCNRGTVDPTCLFKFRDNTIEDDNNTNAGKMQLLRHQISEGRQNIPVPCLEMTSFKNYHTQFHNSSPIQIDVPTVDMEPLPIGNGCNEDTIIQRDETPIPLSPRRFDWSFDCEHPGGNVPQDPLGNPTAFFSMGNANNTERTDTIARRISSYSPPPSQGSNPSTMAHSGDDEVGKKFPLRQYLCFTADDMKTASLRSEQQF